MWGVWGDGAHFSGAFRFIGEFGAGGADGADAFGRRDGTFRWHQLCADSCDSAFDCLGDDGSYFRKTDSGEICGAAAAVHFLGDEGGGNAFYAPAFPAENHSDSGKFYIIK